MPSDSYATEELYASMSFTVAVGAITVTYAAGPWNAVAPTTYTGAGNYNVNLAAGQGVDATQIRAVLQHRGAYPNTPRPVILNWVGGAGGGGDPDLNLQIIALEEGAAGAAFAAGDVAGLDVAIYRVLPVF